MTGLIPEGMAATAVCRLILFSVYLGICALQDLRVRRISIPLSALAGAAAAVLDLPALADGSLDMILFAAGMLPGILLLLICVAAKGAAGSGDGLCFLAAGAMLGPGPAWILLMASLSLTCVCGILLLALGKAKGKTRMPFLTFAGLAWILVLAACR